jgi:hypothetical protein
MITTKFDIASPETGIGRASCNPGDQVLSGGYYNLDKSMFILSKGEKCLAN